MEAALFLIGYVKSNNEVGHVIINGSKKYYVKKGIYHLNNINNYHYRLKKWISRFNGVSTKYLQLYLVWFQFLDNRKMESHLSKKKQMQMLILGLVAIYRNFDFCSPDQDCN